MKRFALIVFPIGITLLVIYGVLILYDDYFPYGRMWETPAIKPHETPLLKMEAGLSPFNGGDGLIRATNGKGLISPFYNKNPKIIVLGKIAYTTYCMFCHGQNHDGMGTVGQSFYPLPAKLTPSSLDAKSDGELFYTISFGNKRSPALATTMTVKDRWAVIHYLRSLK